MAATRKSPNRRNRPLWVQILREDPRLATPILLSWIADYAGYRYSGETLNRHKAPMPPASQATAARELGWSRKTVARNVARLEAEGWVSGLSILPAGVAELRRRKGVASAWRLSPIKIPADVLASRIPLSAKAIIGRINKVLGQGGPPIATRLRALAADHAMSRQSASRALAIIAKAYTGVAHFVHRAGGECRILAGSMGHFGQAGGGALVISGMGTHVQKQKIRMESLTGDVRTYPPDSDKAVDHPIQWGGGGVHTEPRTAYGGDQSLEEGPVKPEEYDRLFAGIGQSSRLSKAKAWGAYGEAPGIRFDPAMTREEFLAMRLREVGY